MAATSASSTSAKSKKSAKHQKQEELVNFEGEFYSSEPGTDETLWAGHTICMAIDTRDLLVNAQLSLLYGHRYGLVGENGCGKTTLLHSLQQHMEKECGIHVAYVGQDDMERSRTCTMTTVEYCVTGDKVLARLRQEMLDIESGDWQGEDLSNRMEEIALEMDQHGNQNAEKRARILLRKLGFPLPMLKMQVSDLSGGWRTRLEIARALFASLDVLMLDEPTNHLDLCATLKLASILRAWKSTLILVSHDAAFMDLVCTDIISFCGGILQCIPGNYATFEEKAEQYHQFHDRIYNARLKEEQRVKDSIENQQRSAKKSGDDRALKQAATRASKVDKIGFYREDGRKYKIYSLHKLDPKFVRMPSKAEAIQERVPVKLCLPDSVLNAGKGSRSLVELGSVFIRYPGSKYELLKGVELSIRQGDRIALVGENGSGKSTLLRVIAGCAGNGVVVGGKVNRSCRIALVDQYQLATLDQFLQASPFMFLKVRHPEFFQNENDVRAHLACFGLAASDRALCPIANLSGGYRVRLVLADVFASAIPPEVLLLDEPTNHLDAETIMALSKALRSFPGAILTVSHNCAFVLDLCYSLWEIVPTADAPNKLVISSGTNSTDFMQSLNKFARKLVPETDWESLDEMMRVRATRYAVVVQQAGGVTSLAVST